MEHLDSEWGRATTIRVPCVAQAGRFPAAGANERLWHSFPRTVGWLVQGDGMLVRDEAIPNPLSFNELLQTWLFFGLIFTVLRNGADESILQFEQLLDRDSKAKDKNITTKRLKDALEAWAEWEMSEERDTTDHRIRMVQLDLVLEKARRVVRKHCSYVDPAEFDPEIHYSEDRNALLFAEHDVVLSIMVLGETIAQVKRNIMAKVRTRPERPIQSIQGWTNEDVSGWGQPRYVVDQMVEHEWCLRTQFLIRKQLGNNAILLFNAYQAYQQDPYSTVPGHECCTAAVCYYIYHENRNNSGGTAPLGAATRSSGSGMGSRGKTKSKDKSTQSNYETAHHYTCRRGTNDRATCEALGLRGPEAQDIESIISNSNGTAFPLLQFVAGANAAPPEIRVVRSDELNGTEFATVSHVWSHGFGNETQNKIWGCQLRAFKDVLREKLTENTPFWMDTLALPVVRKDGQEMTSEQSDLKKLAIAQIVKIFKDSSCTFILDRRLQTTSSAGTRTDEYCNAAVAIIASGWIKRLWTLQEAFMSKKLVIVHKSRLGEYCTDYDDFCREIHKKADEVCSVAAGLVERQLLSSIMRRPADALEEGRPKPDNKEGQEPCTVSAQPANVTQASGFRTPSPDAVRAGKGKEVRVSEGAAVPANEAAAQDETTTPPNHPATQQRDNRDATGDLSSAAIARKTLIADSWRAARWRSTTNAMHETIALATFFELELVDLAKSHRSQPVAKEITNGMVDAFISFPWGRSEEGLRPEEKEKPWQEFWALVSKKEGLDIPAGLIFLPGKKLDTPRLGWAPCTFMSAEEIEPPDPLAVLTTPGKLHTKGLMVECPGYLLHYKDSDDDKRLHIKLKILNTVDPDGFDFPIDNSFQEWYTIKPAPFERTGENPNAAGIAQRRSQLAILLSRPYPRASPAEVGLLVEVYMTQGGVYFVQIISRVLVNRSFRESTDELHTLGHGIFGEVVGHAKPQQWCVGGPNPKAFADLQPAAPRRTTLSVVTDAAASMFGNNLGAKIRRLGMSRHSAAK